MVSLRVLFLSVAAASVAASTQDSSLSESCSSSGAVGTEACRASTDVQPSSENLLLQVGKMSALKPKEAKVIDDAEEEYENEGSDFMVSAESAGDRCHNMRNVEKRCSNDGCKVLATNMRHRSCRDYCGDMGYSCIGAWEEVREDCRVKETLTCDDSNVPTSDLICECSPEGPAEDTPVSDQDLGASSKVPVSTFFWNVHWECSMAAKGASGNCKSAIGRRFVELVHQAKAEIAVSIELSESSSQPASLPGFGLTGWTQVDGPCARPGNGDAAALAFAPTWTVEKSDGGCLRKDYDTRAFAVALAVPPQPVAGCPKLCVLAIHAPHTSINDGMDKVQAVCGEAAHRCAIAMGDWNTPGHSVHRLWRSLIGGEDPSHPQPDVRSCCWPENHHYGVFDHLATNVQGAEHDGHVVHDYQLLEEHPTKQHRAVAAKLLLPAA